MFMTPEQRLASGMLLLEQESYMSYIKESNKKGIANYRIISLLNLDYKIYTIILKNRMRKEKTIPVSCS